MKDGIKRMNYKIIALIGKAGSGKDTLLQRVVMAMPSLHEIVSFTTRPPREGEKDGVNYNFVTGEKFGEMVLENQMLEASCFNDWFYGTAYESLRSDCVNIGVFNPEGIDSLKTHKNIELVVFYVEATDKNRLIRQFNREIDPDVDEIIRRYSADRQDFADLDFHYNALSNDHKNDLRYNTEVVVAAAKRLEDKLNQEK